MEVIFMGPMIDFKPEEVSMGYRQVMARFAACTAIAALASFSSVVSAQQKEIKTGFVYDLTGPFAGGGSEPAQIGTKAAVDMFNEKGGVEGYRINAIFADAQSKVDVAINEMTRLYDQEKVDLVAGLYSSAQCVPMAQQADARKKFLWINVCVASSVMKDKKFSYVFRPTVHSDQYGNATCSYVHNYSQSKFGIPPKNMRIAIIHEDGPYGAGVAAANEIECKKMGMNIVMKEGYAASSPDLSSLVTKLKRARPDVILHTGYNPDITLFLRQAKEQSLKFKALVGHGAGHSQIDKLRQTFGDDVNYFHSADPAAAQLLEPKTLKPGVADLIKELQARYEKVKGPGEMPPHAAMGFNNTYILLHDVLPVAIKKYGGIDAEALRKAALEVDIPVGGTILGFGVKFHGEGTQMAGQNERSFPVVIQYVDDKSYVVWPKSQAQREAVLPLPKGTTFSNQ